MAFFSFIRRQSAPPDDVETLRHRARLRLIGALVLILLVVSFFSLLLETDPRPPTADLPFISAYPEIPTLPPAVTPQSVALTPDPSGTGKKRKGTAITLPPVKPAKIPVAATTSEKTKKQTTQPTTGNWFVQLGAFQNPKSVVKATNLAAQVKIDTFTQEVNTAKGRFIQVRAGPFVSKAQAQKNLKQLKKTGFPDARITKSRK